MEDFPKQVTHGDKYGPAMVITDQAEADAYLEKCVKHTMSFGKSREQAEKIERSNLGYFAGYYDHETRMRVERLFCCKHPILAAAADGPTTLENAFKAGYTLGEERRKQ